MIFFTFLSIGFTWSPALSCSFNLWFYSKNLVWCIFLIDWLVNFDIDSNHNKVNLSINEFYFMRKVSHRFCFSIFLDENVDLLVVRVLSSSWFQVFKSFLGLFEVIHGFINLFKVYYRCFFCQKNGLKIRYYSKKHWCPTIMTTFQSLNFQTIDDRLFL